MNDPININIPVVDDSISTRDLIIALRGGIPEECDFCGEKRDPDHMHPEEAGAWACINCLDRWTEYERNDNQNPPA